jgi:hypothetical protein
VKASFCSPIIGKHFDNLVVDLVFRKGLGAIIREPIERRLS